MNSRPLWRVSVTTSIEAEEAVAQLLERLFHHPPALYTNEKTKISKASVYCQKRAEWTSARRTALAEGLKAIRDAGLHIGPGRITATRVAREDWSESWKRHFKPLEVGPTLLIKPGWSRRRPRRGQAVVVLDPGLSFGTGNHPTTAFCLRQLARCRKTGQSQSVLDIGCGSGILAIAAVKLGYAPIQAFDFDPQAVRVARENARQNKVSGRLSITRQDVTRLPFRTRHKYDVICANLISDLLLAEMKRIIARLRHGGTLLLAGILRKEFPEIQRACQPFGLTLARCRVEKEWRSGAFIFK